MGLSIGKRDVAKIAALIEDGGFESADEAARAVIEACFELYESKAKWALAGQIKWRGDKGYIDSEDAQHARVILGPFGTQTQAENAASQLRYSAQTGEEFRVMSAEFWHGTPAAFYRQRNEQRKAQALADKSLFEQELARRVQWFADNPGVLVYEPDPHRNSWDAANSAEGVADCTHVCKHHRAVGLILTTPDPNDAPSFDD